MSHKGYKYVIDALSATCDKGSVNAVIDAFNLTRRARKMLRDAKRDFNGAHYESEEQALLIRIEVLRELIYGDDC